MWVLGCNSKFIKVILITVLSIPATRSIIPTHITWATDQPVPPLSKLKWKFEEKNNSYNNIFCINLDIVWTEYRLVSLVYMQGRIYILNDGFQSQVEVNSCKEQGWICL